MSDRPPPPVSFGMAHFSYPPGFAPGAVMGMGHFSSGRDGFAPAPAAAAAPPAFAFGLPSPAAAAPPAAEPAPALAAGGAPAPAPPAQLPFGVAAPAFGVAAPAFGAAPLTQATAHPNVNCDVCGTTPILGVRHKCASCADWDCCSACLASGRMEASLDAFSCPHEVLLGVRNPAKTLLVAPPIQVADNGATITVTASYVSPAAAPALSFGAAPDGSFGGGGGGGDGQAQVAGLFGGAVRPVAGLFGAPSQRNHFNGAIAMMMNPYNGRANFATMEAEADGEGRTTSRNV